MLTRLRILKKSERLNDSDCCGTECGKFRKKNKIFAAFAAFALFAVMAVFCTSLGNGILAQIVGVDSVTNDFDIEICKYHTITFQYYLWDDHENCVRFYTDKSVKVRADYKDEDGNAYAIYHFPTDFTKDPYLPETDHTYYYFASFWGPDDENATVNLADGNIENRQWERIWNSELGKDNSSDGSTNLSADSQIIVKGDMIYDVNYYPIKYNIDYVLGWEEAEGWQLGDPTTSIHGSNNEENPGDYSVIYKEEIKAPTRLGYTFSGWSKNDKNAAFMDPPEINSNAESDAGPAAGNNVETYGGNTYHYIPYLDNKYKGANGEHCIGKINPDYDKIMELYEELDKERETGDVTLYAQWKLTQYNITYDLNGGSFADENGNPLQYTYDAASNTFTDESGNPVDVSGAPTTYNVELGDINGNPLPDVTGGSVEERKLTINVKAIPPEGFIFAGWEFYDPEGLRQLSTPIVISHGTVGDFKLKAVFINNEESGNHIVYENVPKEWLEGADKLPETYNNSGDATVISAKDTTREVVTGTDENGNDIIKKYEFTGWTCSNEYSVAPIRVNGALTIPTTTQGDIILVAHWQEITEDAYCTVNYYAQKKPHIGFIPEYKVKAGETITLVENQYTLTSEEYKNAKFAGWYMYTKVGTHLETYKAGDKVTINGDTAFHAKWTTPVTFEPYANEQSKTLYLEYGKPLSYYENELNELFAKTGYQQIGWSLTVNDAIAGNTVDLNTVPVKDNLTLYAVWKEDKFPVTFSNGTNTAEIELSVEKIENVDKVTLPEFSETGLQTKEGCLFGGWLDESKSKVYQPGDKLTVSGIENLTLNAYWINKTQTVTIQDGNSGISDASIEIMLNEDGTYTFKLDDLRKAAGFDTRGCFVVYIGDSSGNSAEIGTVQSGTDVAFSMKETYTAGDFKIKLTDYGAHLFIKSWW